MDKLPPEMEAFRLAEIAGKDGTPQQKQLVVVAHAFRALAKGTAGPGQQKLVLAHALNLAGVPAFDDPNASDTVAAFTRGKRHVGMCLAYLSRTPIAGASTGDETPNG